MRRKNRVQQILTGVGIKDFSPTDELLEQLRMTRKRFFQILKNDSKNELEVQEKESLQQWLRDMFGIEEDIMEPFNEKGLSLKD